MTEKCILCSFVNQNDCCCPDFVLFIMFGVIIAVGKETCKIYLHTRIVSTAEQINERVCKTVKEVSDLSVPEEDLTGSAEALAEYELDLKKEYSK